MKRATTPLAGVRVLDLTRVLAGPFCSMMLGDMGAEVIKVEEPGRGDDTRAWPPFAGGEATYFMSVNRNKQSLTLNLKAPEGREILKKLVARSDVVLENFRPGTMERLGLGYRALSRVNRRLVYGAISGFGESGPEAGRAGYDLTVQGESGLMDLTGFPGAHGVTLALLARARTRRGQKVEVAMLDVMAALLTYQAGIYFAMKQRPTRRGNQHPSIVPYEVFKARDAYLTIGAANDSLWQRCCAALGRPELARDPRFDTMARRVANRDVLVPLFNEIFAKRRAADWLRVLDEAGVPAGRIKTVEEVCTNGHLRAREMIVDLPHPSAGTVTVMGVPIKLHATPGAAATAPPTLGQHTTQILTRLLRLKRSEIERLRKAGVV
ncbi:MAG: formyl-CoA transferase [Candidatus Rokuibacteriota bacterium]|nr:MAG: formyl-CoA transferase [Candidatus Rokubacteria bacterium]